MTTETITSKDVGTVAAVVGGVPAPAPSKAAIARGVFVKCYGMNPVPQRKDIIAEAMTTAGLTQAGAATYLQNFKRDNGLSRSAAAPAPAVVAEVKETTAA